MRGPVASLFVVRCALIGTAQVDPYVGERSDSTQAGWVRYQGGFNFNEGIYRDFQSFRNNAPSIPLEELTDEQDIAIREIRASNRFFHVDGTGERKEIDLDKAWGFCDNDIVFLRTGDGFYRIGMMGTLAHVLFEYNYRDWDPSYYPYGGTTVNTAQAEYVLNMTTGEFSDFTAATMEKALADDEILKPQWDEIPPKKRKGEVLYLFLRRYNDRHPLYFPR